MKKTYGRWTVIGRPFLQNGLSRMKVRCVCGVERVVRVSSLEAGHEAYEELQRLRQEEAVRDTPADPDYDPEIDNSPWFRYEFRLVRERP